MSGSGGSDDWKTRGTSSGSSHPAAEGAEGKPKGGPGTAGGGGGGAAGSSKCEILEETVLNSPDATVIKTLRPGDILSLQQQGRSVVATTIQGQKAGSITFRRLADLLECMGLHYTYVAEVRRITGGTCQVWIHPDQRP